jgi:hypothetical protein
MIFSAQRHAAVQRLVLLGHEDDAKTPFADLFEQLVGADHARGPLAHGVLGRNPLRRRIQKSERCVVHPQQSLEPLVQFPIRAASLLQIRPPAVRALDPAGGVKNGFFVDHGRTLPAHGIWPVADARRQCEKHGPFPQPAAEIFSLVQRGAAPSISTRSQQRA